MFRSYSCDSIYIEADDPRALTDWYKEKFAFKEYASTGLFDPEEEPPGSIFVAPFEDQFGITIAPRQTPPRTESTVPIIFTSNVEKAHSQLTETNVSAQPIQKDRTGRQYFEIRDAEGNLIEICKQ